MSIKIKVGDIVELNNGEVHKVTDMFGDDPLSVSDYGFGPFLINGLRYHQDGRFSDVGFDHDHSVKSVISDADTPTLWRDMTPEEKGALLLAAHEGRLIEAIDPQDGSYTWGHVFNAGEFDDFVAYRIKPEPKHGPNKETVTLYCDGGNLGKDPEVIGTIDRIYGKLDPTSIKIEKL